MRVSAYKDNKEQAFVVFDSMGKNKNEWFNCADIIDSNYIDIKTTSKNYCSMKSGYVKERKRIKYIYQCICYIRHGFPNNHN